MARPGAVTGRQGSSVKALRQELEQISASRLKVDVEEVEQSELDARLVANNIADQLERPILDLTSKGHAQSGRAQHGSRRGGSAHRVQGPAPWTGDETAGLGARGTSAPAHALRKHRLRLSEGALDLRLHRDESEDQQRRDPARRLRMSPMQGRDLWLKLNARGSHTRAQRTPFR
jgi:hypothetical protein